MKKTLIAIIAAAAFSAGSASAFELEGLRASDLRTPAPDFQVPAPSRASGDDFIGMDLAVRVPFKVVKKAVEQASVKDKRISIIDKNAPIAMKSGDFLKLTNIQIDQGGIIVNPTLTLKPYLVAADKLAIRIQRVQLHASMEPTVKAAPVPQLNQEDLMAQVMDVMIKAVYTAVDGVLKKKNLPLKADQVIDLRYDKAAWTLYGTISSKQLHTLIGTGLVGEMHLTGLTFNDTGLAIKVQTAD
ncbi:MAG: hypothetical protein M0025_00500 [Elusimicrobia bacterium]|nr:hypothetical protein [Elusimicrobiota bacterium]